MEFRILGQLEVLARGSRLRLGGGKQRALLAALVLQPNQAVRAERLIELLWGDESPDTAQNVLQVYISQLRKLLEPERQRDEPPRLLVGSSAGYMLTVEPDQLDLERFERLANAARQALSKGESEDASRLFREALALWRGSAVADVEAPFAHAERTRLEELRLAALEDRIEADLALGVHAEVIPELQALTVQYPLRERVCGQLMLALYRGGRQADASAAFHRLRQALDEAEGMEPGPGLQRLLTQILNQDPALQLEPRRVPQTRTGKHNLPLQLTSFVGREDEVREIRRLVGSHRLVTLTGPGGVGKTRLALEVASSFDATYPDGVWLVELGSLADPALVPQAIATTLGIHEQLQRSVLETLVDALQSRELLIVLDNCEHLVQASAAIAETLLQKCAAVRVLGTTRELLRVGGEATWTLSPLALPPEAGAEVQPARLSGFAAVRLFTERAASARPGFTLTEDNASAVAQVCRRLDGMPLALELAAACVAGLSVKLLAERLDQRFRLLVQGRRTALPRQQTLRATIEWSYQLLDQPERMLLARLSVFAGGWTLAAAEQVCPNHGIRSEDVLALLLRLLEKSLVVSDPGKAGDPLAGRYRLLETVREYARERLQSAREGEHVHRRHADYLLTLGEDADRKTSGPEAAKWLAIMSVEHDNLRAALDWSEQTDPVLCLRLATAWAPFWLVRCHFAEGRQRLARALVGAPAATVDRARALNQAVRLAIFQSDYPAATALAGEGLVIAEQLGDLETCAHLLNGLGVAAYHQDDFVAGKTWYERSLAVYQQLGDLHGAGMVVSNLGLYAAIGGDYTSVRRLWNQGVAYLSESGDMRLLTISFINLGYLDLYEGEHASAADYFRKAISIARERADLRLVAESLAGFAYLAAAVSEPERSLRMAGAAAACREAIGAVDPNNFIGSWYARTTALALDPMQGPSGDHAGAQAWAEGNAMDWERAAAYALGESVDVDCDTWVSRSARYAEVRRAQSPPQPGMA